MSDPYRTLPSTPTLTLAFPGPRLIRWFAMWLLRTFSDGQVGCQICGDATTSQCDPCHDEQYVLSRWGTNDPPASIRWNRRGPHPENDCGPCVKFIREDLSCDAMRCDEEYVMEPNAMGARVSRYRRRAAEKPRWRVGSKLGRTLYRDEVFVGTVDTREIAEEIVQAMNAVDLALPC
jgi:hypothetical protein